MDVRSPKTVTKDTDLDTFIRDNSDDALEIVKQILPTCGEYLLVDRVLEEGPNTLSAQWSVPEDGPWFRTDGAGQKLLLPGTVTTEHLIQAGEILIYRERGGRPEDDGVPVLARIRSARYRAMVKPGDVLTSELRLTETVGAAYYVTGIVKVGAQTVLKAELTFTATNAISVQ